MMVYAQKEGARVTIHLSQLLDRSLWLNKTMKMERHPIIKEIITDRSLYT
jgi:hypothetical protein